MPVRLLSREEVKTWLEYLKCAQVKEFVEVTPTHEATALHRLIAEFRRVAEGLAPAGETGGYAWRSQLDPFSTPEWRALCAASNAWNNAHPD